MFILDAKQFEEILQSPAAPYLARAMMGSEETPHGEIQRTLRCSWRVAVENALEDLHVPFVHPATFHRLGLKATGVLRLGPHSYAEYRVTDPRTLRGLQTLARWFRFPRPNLYFHLFLYPHTCLSSLGGLTYSLQSYRPQGNDTAFRSYLYPGRQVQSAPKLGFFFDSALAFNHRVFEEDAKVCEAMIPSELEPDLPLMEGEERLRWFREEVRRG